ncbi:hypothetical protein T4D_6449 [Trichinella pseudospiralis]|uniref:Uncharacterized protein n=1 Tax=Trichinella pseudospiralis TaxID=6337 RepID=A0A0V1FVM6_TRIPS|nr:hypothetical protein T4D_6449 [Trichinella pseudospiralis]
MHPISYAIFATVLLTSISCRRAPAVFDLFSTTTTNPKKPSKLKTGPNMPAVPEIRRAVSQLSYPANLEIRDNFFPSLLQDKAANCYWKDNVGKMISESTVNDIGVPLLAHVCSKPTQCKNQCLEMHEDGDIEVCNYFTWYQESSTAMFYSLDPNNDWKLYKNGEVNSYEWHCVENGCSWHWRPQQVMKNIENCTQCTLLTTVFCRDFGHCQRLCETLFECNYFMMSANGTEGYGQMYTVPEDLMTSKNYMHSRRKDSFEMRCKKASIIPTDKFAKPNDVQKLKESSIFGSLDSRRQLVNVIPRAFFPQSYLTYAYNYAAGITLNKTNYSMILGLCNTDQLRRSHYNDSTKYFECEPYSKENQQAWKIPDLGQWVEKPCRGDHEEFVENEQRCVKAPKRKKTGRGRCYPLPNEKFSQEENGLCDLSRAALRENPNSVSTYFKCMPSSRRRHCGFWSRRPCFSGGLFNVLLQLCISPTETQYCPSPFVTLSPCASMGGGCPSVSVCIQGYCCMQPMYPISPMLGGPIGAPYNPMPPFGYSPYSNIPPSVPSVNLVTSISTGTSGIYGCPNQMMYMGPCSQSCGGGSVCISGSCCMDRNPMIGGMISPYYASNLGACNPHLPCWKGCPPGMTCQAGMCCGITLPAGGVSGMPYFPPSIYFSSMGQPFGSIPYNLPPINPLSATATASGLNPSGIPTFPFLPRFNQRTRLQQPHLCSSGELSMRACSEGCSDNQQCENGYCCSVQLPVCPLGGLALTDCKSGCKANYACFKNGCCPLPNCPNGQLPVDWCSEDGKCPVNYVCLNKVCCRPTVAQSDSSSTDAISYFLNRVRALTS